MYVWEIHTSYIFLNSVINVFLGNILDVMILDNRIIVEIVETNKGEVDS